MIIATGAQARWLGLPSEEIFRGFGVSACATCDGFFFRGKEVVVVGGGNTAVEEALYLTNHARRVTLIHRRDALRAEKILQERLFRNPKIDIIWDTRGRRDPRRARAAAGDRGAAAQRCNRRAARASPATACSSRSATRRSPLCSRASWRSTRRAISSTRPDRPRPSIPGVFAAGDVKDKIFRQAVTAAGMGCMAALEAEKFLAAQEEAATMRAAE